MPVKMSHSLRSGAVLASNFVRLAQVLAAMGFSAASRLPCPFSVVIHSTSKIPDLNSATCRAAELYTAPNPTFFRRHQTPPVQGKPHQVFRLGPDRGSVVRPGAAAQPAQATISAPSRWSGLSDKDQVMQPLSESSGSEADV